MGFNFVQAPINEPFFVNDRISPIWLDYFNRLIGKEEFENLEDAVDTLKSTVDLLNEDSESALEVLTTWSSDGVLSPDEKVVMNAGFIERCIEYVTILTQATAFSISTDTLTETFEDWGTYLNNGVSWSAPESTTITDDDIPSWINETGQASSTTVVQADFVNYATLYFAALTAIKVLIEEYITENLTGVVDIIAGWAVDGKFSPIEKAHMNVGWIARSTEYLEVKAAAEDLTLSTDTFKEAFETWGTYLNNDVAWEAPTTTPILDADMPVWIQEDNLGTTTDIEREEFIEYASDYLNALIVMKIAIAENVNDNIEGAVNTLADWASDESFTYLEKVAFKEGWDIRSVEYLNLYNQAIDLGLTTAANTFKLAFEAWGTYLNDGDAWTALESLPVNDDKTPAWINIDNRSTSTSVSKTAFVETANTYFTALGVIKDLIAETIGDNISGAIDTLDNWAKDTVFAPIEKKAFYDGWKIRSTEFLDIKARADELSIDTDDLVDYFEDWGTYLNDDVAWTAPSVVGDIIDDNMPSYFNTSDARKTATTVVRADFVNNAQAYLIELYTVRGLIADQVNTNASTAQTTADGKIKTFYQDSIPTSVSIGDIWFDTDDSNKQYRAASVGADAITAGEWESAQDSSVTDALDTLDDWASDTVFSPVEKKAFYDGWKRRSIEFLDLKAKATDLGLSAYVTTLNSAFDAWGTYLNDGDAWTPPSVVGDIIDANLPSWFNDSTARSTPTTVVRATFVSTAQTYFNALLATQTAVYGQIDSDISSAASTANWSDVADDDSNKPENNADVTNLTNITTAVQSNTLAFSATSGKISFGGSTHYINGTSSNLNLVGGTYNTLTMNDSTGINLSARYGIDITDTVSGGIDINSSSGTVYLRTTSGNASVYGVSTTLGTGNTVTCNTSGVTITAAGSGDDVNIIADDNCVIDVDGDIVLTGTNLTWNGSALSGYTHPSYVTTNINASGTEVIALLQTNSTGHITTMTKRYLPIHGSSTSGVVHPSYRVYCDGITTTTAASKIHDLTPPSSGGAGQVGSSSYYYYWSYTNQVNYKSMATFDFIDDLDTIQKMSYKKDESGEPILNPNGSMQSDTSTYHDCLTNRHEIFNDIRKNRENDLTKKSSECVLKLDKKFKDEELAERNALIIELYDHQSELDELEAVENNTEYSVSEYHEAIADDTDVPITSRYSISVDEIKDMEFLQLDSNIGLATGGLRQLDKVVNDITIEFGEWLADHENKLDELKTENMEQKILLETQASKITILETQLASVLKRLDTLEDR